MKKLILLTLLIVGCAPTKPPLATFYVGMTEKEFLELNKNKPITENPIKHIDKNTNMSQYHDGNEPNLVTTYWYTFRNDTLRVVHGGTFNMLLRKEVDYNKYATPPELIESEAPDVKKPEIEMNILDGNISSGSTTLKTEDIIKDCKKECVTFTISSDEWCDCMHQCSQYFLKVFDRISFGDMNVKIYIEECPRKDK